MNSGLGSDVKRSATMWPRQPRCEALQRRSIATRRPSGPATKCLPVALDLFPAVANDIAAGCRRTPEKGRLPATYRLAAPHVGRQPDPVPASLARGRCDIAPINGGRHRHQGRTDPARCTSSRCATKCRRPGRRQSSRSRTSSTANRRRVPRRPPHRPRLRWTQSGEGASSRHQSCCSAIRP